MSDEQDVLENIILAIRSALQDNRFDDAATLLADLHSADQAEVFDALEDEERSALLTRLDIETTADLLEEMEDKDVLDVVDTLSNERLADVLDEMEPDEAADLLGDLPPTQASEVLAQMEFANDVRPLLNYGDDTAGGLMTTSFIALRRQMTADEAISFLRQEGAEADVPYYLYVVDRYRHLIGLVGLRELVLAAPDTLIESIMDPEVIFISATSDQEEAARIMSRYDLALIPVVDEQNVLVGVITHDDILDVIEEEATEDIYRLATVTDSELEPESPVLQQIRGRLPWLFVNTLTAGFAAWVVSTFEETIAAVAVLAVFQSIIAGQGGNSASQNVAMIVRSLALGKFDIRELWPVLIRQIEIGFLQGVAVGVVVGFVAYVWQGNPWIGLVVALALIGNMILAGIIGTLVPVILARFGQDPALASTIFVTAVTDAGGFFIFFSLASMVLDKIIENEASLIPFYYRLLEVVF